MNRTVGILGGMGSAASEIFYKMIVDMTDVSCDQDYPDLVIYSDAGMPDRTEAILAKNYDEVRERMLDDIKKLVQCDCEAIGVTCNTAHFFIDMLEKEIPVPIIHMVKETVNQIADQCPGGRVAILATDGTVTTGLYQNYMQKAGLKPFVPDQDMQDKVMYEIYECIKKSKAADMEMWNEIERNVKAAGCQKAILGCTELSVIQAQNHLNQFYVDPLKVLARKIIEFSGKKVKEEYR